MTREDWVLTEEGDRYLLSRKPGGGYHTFSLGMGPHSIVIFDSAEAREYYIEAREWEEKALYWNGRAEACERELAELRTRRGAWRNLWRIIRK